MKWFCIKSALGPNVIGKKLCFWTRSLCLCHFLVALFVVCRNKDATIDALDLVLDGVDTIWGWVAGSKEAGRERSGKSGSFPKTASDHIGSIRSCSGT
jgi:hypothetical protein